MIPTSYIQEELRRYSEQHSDYPSYLDDIERMTNLETLAPQMISGIIQGRLLSFISKIKKPKTILEIGSFTGYSALCLAEGLQSDGILHSIEIDNKYDRFIEYIDNHIKLAEKIIFHKADALNLIPTLNLTFDLVFVDAAKKDYLNYLKVVEKFMPKDSILISDNMLYSGKVIEDNKDRETEVLHQYNFYLKNSPHWDTMLLPYRDGISIAIKQD